MILRTHARNEITVQTTKGKVTYSRYLLIPQGAQSKSKLLELTGGRSVAPLDCYLGLAGLPFKISPMAMLDIAYWAQNQGSYQRAEDIISKVMGVSVNDDTVRGVTNFIGGIVFENDCVRAGSAFEAITGGKLEFPMDKKGVLYIQTDGASVNTRMMNEAGSTWRENKLGEVFSSDGMRFWTDRNGVRQHQILKKEYVSYIGSVEEFKKHLAACALRGGYGRFRETVILGDGATWIRNMAKEFFPDAQQILDYFHLCENVTDYAKALFNKDEAKFRPWARDICERLKAGGYKSVLASLEPLRDKVFPNTVNLYGYISNNIDNIEYDSYISKGYFIGSGAIESGNKTVVQDRLKRAGMRWNVSSAQAMLTLKSKVESNLWHADVVKPFIAHCAAVSNTIIC